MPAPTFAQIEILAAALNRNAGPQALGHRVDAILDSARVNADATIYVEKAQPEAAWNSIAVGSIRDILSYSSDARAQRWFLGIGVDF